MATEEEFGLYIKGLDGISYYDWLRLRLGIDTAFKNMLNEAKVKLHIDLKSKE